MDIIFENEEFIALNKPSGMLSIPDRTQSSPSLKDILQSKYGEIFTVHRLDKNTSGLIIFAKNKEIHKILSEKFMSRAMEKYYLGLVNGTLYPLSGLVEKGIAPHPSGKGMMIIHSKGKPSVTRYETIESFKNFSLVKFHILTGRTHQIRVHTKYLGSFIIGDELYGDGKPVYISQIKKDYKLSKDQQQERPILNRLALHAHQLNFQLNEKNYQLEAPLPKDLTALIKQLRKNN